MSMTIKALAEKLGLEAAGNTDLKIRGAAEPQDAGASDIAVAMSPKYAENLPKGAARAAILWDGADFKELGLEAAIFATRPRLAMSGLTRALDAGQFFKEGIHPSAVVDDSAVLGAGVSVGPNAVIGPRANIGAGSVIGPMVFIGADAIVGDHCFLREQASIGARVRLGDRVILQPGAKLGGDGFSFVTKDVSHVETARSTMDDPGAVASQEWLRIHSLGAVVVGDDVEIGMNATIDNGTIRDTVIGRGSKLDNQVHVGHNCVIGENCLLCGQVGLAGTVVLGNNVVLGGQSGVADNLQLGDNVVVGGGGGVISNVSKGKMVMGYPAVKMSNFTEMYKASRRLPRLLKEFSKLQKTVSNSDDKG